jgi:hypothetical protein
MLAQHIEELAEVGKRHFFRSPNVARMERSEIRERSTS